MADFITSDLHLFHDSALEHRPQFKNHDQMTKTYRRKWNEKISDNDTVFIAGDLTLKGIQFKPQLEQFIRSLKGTKILVLGNHDRLNPFDYIDIGFQSVHTCFYYNEQTMIVHDPAPASFYPNLIFLCGHVHDLFVECGNAINTGVDVRDGYPVLISDLLKNKT